MNFLQKSGTQNTNSTLLQQIHGWGTNQNLLTKIWLTFFFAGLTGLFAQLRIYLPWTPIPITLQTVAVIASGLLLGKYFGLYSQVLYLVLGFVGIPWFANQQSGIAILYGPTAGYLIGFCLASFVTGWLLEKYSTSITSSRIVFLLLAFINFVSIYTPGLIYLYFWFSLTSVIQISFFQLLVVGFFPFVFGDIIKIAFITLVHSNNE